MGGGRTDPWSRAARRRPGFSGELSQGPKRRLGWAKRSAAFLPASSPRVSEGAKSVRRHSEEVSFARFGRNPDSLGTPSSGPCRLPSFSPVRPTVANPFPQIQEWLKLRASPPGDEPLFARSEGRERNAALESRFLRRGRPGCSGEANATPPRSALLSSFSVVLRRALLFGEPLYFVEFRLAEFCRLLSSLARQRSRFWVPRRLLSASERSPPGEQARLIPREASGREGAGRSCESFESIRIGIRPADDSDLNRRPPARNLRSPISKLDGGGVPTFFSQLALFSWVSGSFQTGGGGDARQSFVGPRGLGRRRAKTVDLERGSREIPSAKGGGSGSFPPGTLSEPGL